MKIKQMLKFLLLTNEPKYPTTERHNNLKMPWKSFRKLLTTDEVSVMTCWIQVISFCAGARKQHEIACLTWQFPGTLSQKQFHLSAQIRKKTASKIRFWVKKKKKTASFYSNPDVIGPFLSALRGQKFRATFSLSVMTHSILLPHLWNESEMPHVVWRESFLEVPPRRP